ncbi:conserved hypothetical protein [Methylobacterium sp. 4-46]|uniref:DUF2147 domain-containing protein n=1 Tax=unclassified Methylobacterium TaxID=2615210 RepID=UPI000152C9D3|nr:MULTISPECIES: DUF2147 domain-containing protein [Methylobacterium]ACA18703.1 conserved hypothetical protein [Methylobacterium sp. 4-46]WFT77935.1 DUF2147 domain-containing protein [Methylobacterium nodulans]
MRSVRTPALTAFLLLAGTAAQAGTDPSGTWLTEDGRAKIKIERCGPAGSQACGTVVWLKVPLNDQGQPRTDIKNPDPKKRQRPVIGLQLMEGLKPDEAGYKGQIYNAEEGKFYEVTIARESASELSISGCLLKVLCGSQTWTKAPDEVAQAAPAKPAAKPKTVTP